MHPALRVLALVTNIPGPLAAAAFVREGARVTKVEPPAGDALAAAAPAWYEVIASGMEVLRLDLREEPNRERLDTLLESADLLITATRAASLRRLGLAWDALHERFPRICHVAIVGEAAPHDDRAGHDLTYQAQAGLLDPPAMPRTVFADLFAAERAVAAAYGALYERERTGAGTRREVAIADGAAQFADGLRYGLTGRDGPLGGALPVYRLYPTRDGWIALAALEGHFQAKLREALNVESLDVATLGAYFARHSCAHCEALARQFDLPLSVVADVRPAE